jgi:transcriptional regulator with XRE-family HTH domain
MAKRTKARVDLRAIGARIRELRAGMLQEELAEYLGISQGQLSKLERGLMAPTAETLARLSETFEKSIDWIVQGD